MFRYKQIWIDPNTPKRDPQTKILQLDHGRIVRWWIGFPDGCADLVHCTIYHFEHQIIPKSEEESVFWNNYIFEIPDSYKLEEEPYEIEVRAWNEDDRHAHTVVVGVALEPMEEVTLADLYRAFRAFLETMVGPPPE